MPVDVIGIDHIYIAVRELVRSEAFYDLVMEILGFRKKPSTIAGSPHVHYFNRHFGFSLRPALPGTADHDPYAPGLHHFCFRVADEASVDHAFAELTGVGLTATDPRHYPEYAPDYYGTFFNDPDGVRLEITNFRRDRRLRMYQWEGLVGSAGREPESAPNQVVADEQVQRLNDFGRYRLPGMLGMEILSCSAARVTGRVTVTRPLIAGTGFLWAPVVVGLADTLCAYGTGAARPKDSQSFTTVELKTNFLGTAGEGETILGEAKPAHLGRITQVWDASIMNEATRKVIGLFRCTQLILYPR